MALSALRAELERNMELARDMRSVIRGERDMLQGEARERVALHRFHTDAWDAVVAAGDMDALGDAAAPVSSCYGRLKEVNELVDTFDAHGNTKLFSPLLREAPGRYGREHVLDIIASQCEAVMEHLRDATTALGDQQARECPVCGELFASPTGMKSHVTQKSDDAHQQAAVDL